MTYQAAKLDVNEYVTTSFHENWFVHAGNRELY